MFERNDIIRLLQKEQKQENQRSNIGEYRQYGSIIRVVFDVKNIQLEALLHQFGPVLFENRHS